MPAVRHTPPPGLVSSPAIADPTPPQGNRRTARIALIAVGVAALLGLGVGGAKLLSDRSDRAHGPGTSASTSTTPGRPTDAQDIATALERLERDPAGVVATQAKEFVPDPGKAFPKGTTVAPKSGTWAPDGTGSGGTMTVAVTYPGKPAATYLAIMVREPSGWKVLATMEADK